MDNTTRIAGFKTVSDWKDLRNNIRINPDDQNLWNKAYDLFEERLETRYFKPIRDIKNNDKQNGEGFSIVTVLCSLIEFLETTWSGEIYRYCNDSQLQSSEYNRSKLKFISFFENRPPFDSVFTSTNGLAQEFYENVRCGLLHEASTKLNWIIRVDNQNEFYEFRDREHVIDRNIFEKRIKEYLKYYKTQLLNHANLQNAFVRKMNGVAGLEIDY